MEQVYTDTIVIEGFGGAGKTTAAQNLALRYGYSNFNTGSLFRATAAAMLLQRVELPDLRFFVDESAYRVDLSDPVNPLIAVSGLNVTDMLQLPEVTRLASFVGSQSSVANHIEQFFDAALVGKKRVVEGKSIGDRVQNKPGHRFFLTATRDARAHRKWQQALHRGSSNYSLQQARIDTFINDARDQKLLTIRAGTRILDTTTLSPLQVVEAIKQRIDQAALVV